MKDSFADVDLSGAGFDLLFDAEWISRPAGRGPRSVDAGQRWAAVRDRRALGDWALAWRGSDTEPLDLFRPGLLADPQVEILAARLDGGPIVAGAVLNRSTGAVGLSNLFAVDGDSDAAWNGAVAAAGVLHPGLPIVGYEHGEDLAAALRQGFTAIGPLRVWLRTR